MVVLAVVVWPFMQTRQGAAPKDESGSEASRLRAAREEIYLQISQLRSDHDANLIGEDDYQNHLTELRISAAELMRAEQGLPSEMTAQDRLEEKIRSTRRRRRGRA
jgi:hypothetical protein